MKKRMTGIMCAIGMTVVPMVMGSTDVSAEAMPFEDKAESKVDILVKEDPNVSDKVFKFDSVPSGFAFLGDLKNVGNNKLAMQGVTVGNVAKIGVKTDIDDAKDSNFKVTGKMEQVVRNSDKKIFDVDTFTLSFDKKTVDVKNGVASILDKSLIGEEKDTEFYHYLYTNEITGSNLSITTNDSVSNGDEFSGTLSYTLSGSIDFA